MNKNFSIQPTWQPMKKSPFFPIVLFCCSAYAMDNNQRGSCEESELKKARTEYREPHEDAINRLSVAAFGIIEDARSECTPINLAMLAAILDAGANINARNSEGATLLHSWASYPREAQYLVERGADVNATENDGWTPLHVGLYERMDTDTVRLFVERGADVNARTRRDGWTPLFDALDRGIDFVRFFIEHGANPNDKNNWGHSILHHAAQDAHVDVETCTFLFDRGINLGVRDIFGNTPLHFCRENVPVCSFLIAKGVGINTVNYRGKTALHKLIDAIKRNHSLPGLRVTEKRSASLLQSLVNNGAYAAIFPRQVNGSGRSRIIATLLTFLRLRQMFNLPPEIQFRILARVSDFSFSDGILSYLLPHVQRNILKRTVSPLDGVPLKLRKLVITAVYSHTLKVLKELFIQLELPNAESFEKHFGEGFYNGIALQLRTRPAQKQEIQTLDASLMIKA